MSTERNYVRKEIRTRRGEKLLSRITMGRPVACLLALVALVHLVAGELQEDGELVSDEQGLLGVTTE